MLSKFTEIINEISKNYDNFPPEDCEMEELGTYTIEHYTIKLFKCDRFYKFILSQDDKEIKVSDPIRIKYQAVYESIGYLFEYSSYISDCYSFPEVVASAWRKLG